MERKIGEEFEIKLRLKVVESGRACMKCIFIGSQLCTQIDQLGNCVYLTRNDLKDVHFELVSSDEV